jgi:hypothetical protein
MLTPAPLGRFRTSCALGTPNPPHRTWAHSHVGRPVNPKFPHRTWVLLCAAHPVNGKFSPLETPDFSPQLDFFAYRSETPDFPSRKPKIPLPHLAFLPLAARKPQIFPPGNPRFSLPETPNSPPTLGFSSACRAESPDFPSRKPQIPLPHLAFFPPTARKPPIFPPGNPKFPSHT